MMDYTTKSQKLCAHILCTNGAFLGGYCSDHQSERAEAAEVRANALNTECNDLHSTNARLEAERDELRRQLEQEQNEVERLRRFLQTVVNLGDVKKHAAFDGERHREMRHCANQALMTTKEIYEP